ncbi:MAG TPA: hypothetical protein VGM88_18075 [Kofleriaceae bacterium]|jgi:hypothetical protein
MSTIGGPGGIGGPKGPSGPSDVDAPDAATETSAATAPSELEAIAAQIQAGTLSPQEAIEKLVGATGADPELRELMLDLVANDPYLSQLVGRL